MSKSALAITEEHTDLADSVIGQLNRLSSRGAARATLEKASDHPSEIWSATLSGWPSVTDSEVNRNSLSERSGVVMRRNRVAEGGTSAPLAPGP